MEKEKNSLFSVADIVKRAKRVLNFKTDADLAAYLGVTTSELLGEEITPSLEAEPGIRCPPEYDLLKPEDKALIDNMIHRLILEKDQESTSSPSN